MVPRLQVVRGTRWARGGDRRDGSGMIRRKLLRNMPGKQSEGSGPLRHSESVRRVPRNTCRGTSRLQVVRGTRWAQGGARRDGSGMIRRKLLRNMLGKQSEPVAGAV